MLVRPQEAIDELGITPEDFSEFLQDLSEYLAEAIPSLAAAIEHGQRSEVREVAHSIKGALRNLRFIDAGEKAMHIEKWGAGERDDAVQPMFSALAQSLVSSFAEIARPELWPRD